MMWLLIIAPIELAFLVIANARRAAIEKKVREALDLDFEDP